jgi:hypothetical protein
VGGGGVPAVAVDPSAAAATCEERRRQARQPDLCTTPVCHQCGRIRTTRHRVRSFAYSINTGVSAAITAVSACGSTVDWAPLETTAGIGALGGLDRSIGCARRFQLRRQTHTPHTLTHTPARTYKTQKHKNTKTHTPERGITTRAWIATLACNTMAIGSARRRGRQHALDTVQLRYIRAHSEST